MRAMFPLILCQTCKPSAEKLRLSHMLACWMRGNHPAFVVADDMTDLHQKCADGAWRLAVATARHVVSLTKYPGVAWWMCARLTCLKELRQRFDPEQWVPISTEDLRAASNSIPAAAAQVS